MRIGVQRAACRRAGTVTGLFVLLCASSLRLDAGAREHEGAPAPALSLPVAPLGYRPPAKIYVAARFSVSSLDFLDATHLLFSFREPRLLTRTEHSSGLDQSVHAVVLQLPSGQVVEERHWLLQDHERYLWSLGNGEALLRIGDRLFRIDRHLQLKAFFTADTPLREVDPSFDGRLLVLETDRERHTPEEHARLIKHAEEVGADPPTEDAEIRMVRLDELKLKLTARADHAGTLPATADGFLMNERLNQLRWNVRFRDFAQTQQKQKDKGAIVAQVDSTCQPVERFLNNDTTLVMTCPPKHDDHYAAAYSLKGQKLWDGRWPGSYLWPTFRSSSNGETIAISWLVAERSAFGSEVIDDSGVQGQALSVLDSRTGNLRMGLRLDPILSAGGNFALSADGNRLAVLNKGSIQIYDIPAKPATQTAHQ